MALTNEDLAAIRAEAKAGAAEALREHDAAIAASLSTEVLESDGGAQLVRDLIAALRAEGVIPEIDHEIVGHEGPFYWTRGSAKLMPGRRFLSVRSLPFCTSEEERQLVLQNCAINPDGSLAGHSVFGDFFAQAGSNLTPKLQGAVTPAVHPVKQLGFGFVLDRTHTVRESSDGFPLDFAVRGLTPQEELEWVRLTAAHRASITGGWKGQQP